MEMKRITVGAFQGDVAFIKVDKLPDNAKKVATKGPIIVAHSETGHHHTIDENGVAMFEVGDPMVCYLQIEGGDKAVTHHRPFHTHESFLLAGGDSVWEVRRQRESTPEGWRVVAD